MSHQVEYRLSDGLNRAALRRNFLEMMKWRLPLIILILALVAVLGFLLAPDDFVHGLFVGVALGAGSVIVAAFGLQAIKPNDLLQKLATKDASCRIDENGMVFDNAMGHTELTWPMIPRVIRGRLVWLIFLSKGRFVPLPAAVLAGAPGEMIVENVRRAGGKVV